MVKSRLLPKMKMETRFLPNSLLDCPPYPGKGRGTENRRSAVPESVRLFCARVGGEKGGRHDPMPGREREYNTLRGNKRRASIAQLSPDTWGGLPRSY